jgi:polyhydroxyalkanoate synthesis regulator phasin
MGYPLPMDADESTTNKDRKSLSEVFERAWSQALVAMSTVEEEAVMITHRLGEAAGWSQEEARRHVREFTERLAHQRKDLEGSVEEGVKRALSKVRVPRREEIAELQARLDRIAARIDSLTGGR